ncbi:hypothetical protein GGTG_02366 [Gaeumannomyces tritici R3-111a-1]|uniref:H/ACA ribonucleoprotein complex non-core subunit NAF1 n=1 Tax=Gaeumannomyces tritici (strain R3-111a-1) TaxID=644352 RepID=J3NM62_GAET3|nr:hypothetical protein GGTG_02366 [Gaeumannomyces tritici R3-111a-1]EJT82393.1 hypothetical protein GGTG_02366 [Gaeumannomyces tritici R3-111a-1]
MSGGFVIPGLGHAKPNEKLPTNSFAPDVLAAAASLGHGVANKEATATNGSALAVAGRAGNKAVIQGEGVSESGQMPGKGSEIGGSDAMDMDQMTETAAAIGPITMAESTISDATTVIATAGDASDAQIPDALDAAILAMVQPEGEAQAQASTAPGDSQPQEQPIGQPPAEQQGAGAEWEADSSPYESSSDLSSSDDSDDDSDGELMGLDETVKMLMAGADGSEDEGDGGDKAGKAAQMRTKNELPDWVPPKPSALADDAVICQLGTITSIVGAQILITSGEDGEEKVLDVETPVCRADKSVIAAIADVIGNVLQPMYILRFATPEDVAKEGLKIGDALYYPPGQAQVVLTRPLRSQKGYDASNLHDEELATEEMEFSDDEREQAYKRELKMKKRGNRGRGASGLGGGYTRDNGRPGPGSTASSVTAVGDAGLNYDDEDDDGPYKPLTRPANFGMGAPPSREETLATAHRPPFTHGHRGNRDHFRGGGRGGNRGGRGGFRGGRGGGGGYPDGHSQRQQPRHQQQQQSQPQHQPQQQRQPQPQQQAPSQQTPSVPQWNFPAPPPLPFAPPQTTAQPAGAPFTFPGFPQPNPYGMLAPLTNGQFPPPPIPPPVAGQPSANWQAMSALYANPTFVRALRDAAQAQQQQQQQGQGQGQPHNQPGWGHDH